MTADARRQAPAAARNRDPILVELRRWLPDRGLVLEIASGTGEHVLHFAAALPNLTFQPSDPDADARASIDAWTAGQTNIRRALPLDVTQPWPVAAADAILCINMIHIAPWEATPALAAGAARLLPPGGPLVLYGPYLRAAVPTAPGNVAFDESLRARDPRWGIRDLEAVTREMNAAGLDRVAVTEMPANNLVVVFRRP